MAGTGHRAGACDQVYDEHARMCRNLIEALDEKGPFRVVAVATDPDAAHRVFVRCAPKSGGAAHWIVCRFAGGGLDAGRLDLIAVETDRDGVLSDVQLHLLKRFWIQEFGGGDVAVTERDEVARDGAYAIQQLIDAIGLLLSMFSSRSPSRSFTASSDDLARWP